MFFKDYLEQYNDKKMKIFVDMDGVIVDYEFGLADNFHIKRNPIKGIKDLEIIEKDKPVLQKTKDGIYIIKGVVNKFNYDLVIPEGTVVIDDNAFANTNIISVVVPDTVRRIGKRAFYSCKHLTKVNIPASVLDIDDEAFAECDNLEIVVPDFVKIKGKNLTCNTATDLREKKEKIESHE